MGIAALEFGKVDATSPHYARVNLEHERARIMVIKKHQTILTRVAEDLKKVAKKGVRLSEIPALVIDDESDQASINTRRSAIGLQSASCVIAPPSTRPLWD